jgi:hypothetical protein
MEHTDVGQSSNRQTVHHDGDSDTQDRYRKIVEPWSELDNLGVMQ